MLRSTRRGLETWHGRDSVTLADERARQRGTQTSTYTGAPVLDPTFKSATDMRWDMHDPVCDGRILYARYTSSYMSLLPEARGKRAMFEGVAIMRLRDGRIADYREVANT